jgi:hypothetical protein
MDDDGSPPPQSPVPASKRRSKLSKLASPDSGVRIVPLEPSDSDVKVTMEPADEGEVSLGGSKSSSASDSDIRLNHPARDKGGESDMVTEEIDLDAEVSKLGTPTPPPRPRPSTPQLPTSSPFELSEEDLDMDGEQPTAAQQPQSPGVDDSSGDFELTPAGDDFSPLELGSDEMPALNIDDSDEVSLGEISNAGGGSGINLRDPADSGISLEQDGSDEISFDSLDAGGTPPPSATDDSDSEFELSLDDDSSETESAADSSEFELSLDEEAGSSEEMETPHSSSEFELSLDDDSGSSELELDLEPVEGGGAEDSDSEFELTLDDSGGSSPLEEEAAEDKDIFETDFEVPALEEESGSEAVALDEDTSTESSDFDLAIDEMDVDSEDESGSQVVALEDDEEAGEEFEDDEDARPKRKTKLLQAEDDEDASEFAGIGPALDEEEEEEADVAVVGAAGKGKVQYVEKEPAQWGAMPVVLMLPCILVLFVVGLMGFELVTGMVSYQRTGKFTGLLITPITEAITGEPVAGSSPKSKK